MTVFRNILWWLAFLCLAIVLQILVPGLDAMLVAVPLAARERDWKALVWRIPVIVILQEGMGSQFFGAEIAAVAAAFLVYRLAVGLSLSSGAVFAVLLSAGMGLSRFALGQLFATLQNAPLPVETGVDDGLTEAAYVLVSWFILTRLRGTVPNDEQQN